MGLTNSEYLITFSKKGKQMDESIYSYSPQADFWHWVEPIAQYRKKRCWSFKETIRRSKARRAAKMARSALKFHLYLTGKLSKGTLK
jgi:hypothetical protein